MQKHGVAQLFSQRPIQAVTAFLAVGLACGLVMISLQSAHTLCDTDAEQASKRQLYISKQILPDNTLYPLFRIPEQVRLRLLSPEHATLFQVELGQERLADAKALMEKGNEPLALATMQKAQMYLLEAGTTALHMPLSPHDEATVTAALSEHLSEVEQLQTQIQSQDATQVGELKVQTESLLSQLTE